MKATTKKTTTTKTTTATTKKATVKGGVNLTAAQKKELLSKVEKKATAQRGGVKGSNIYVVDYEGMSDREKKNFRGKMRRSLFRHINSVIFHGELSKNKEGLNEAIEAFKVFAKANYVNPTFDNVGNYFTGNDQSKIAEITLALQIVQKASK